MARIPKTPGVYIEEVSILPPYVAAVETAVPAFVGHSEKAADRTGDLKFTAVEIGSIAEFREKYGVGPEVKVKAIHLQPDNTVSEVELDSEYYLYDSLRLFYDNGGGKCFIVSIGDFDEDVSAENLKKGLNVIALEDRPTMLVMPDAIALADGKIYGVQQAALKQCGDLKDRFAILDLLEVKDSTELSLKESVEDFRNEIGMSYLKYGAAYAPHLRANLPKTVTFRNIRGNLKRQGVKLDASSLLPEGVTSTLGSVNNAIDDVDTIKGAISGFVRANGGSNNEIMTIVQVFKLANDEFQSESGKLLSEAPPTNQLLATTTAFQHLFELTYALIQRTVDEHAIPNANNLLKVTGNRKIARDQISNGLRTSVQRLNRMTVGAASLTGVKAIDRLYTNFAVSATQWGGAYDAALAALTGTDLTSVYPRDMHGLTVAALLRAQGQNMANAAKQVVSTFETVRESAVAILSEAKETERQANEALRDAAPQLRKVIDEVADAQTTLPPSGVIAGIYSHVDGTGGVFKAPANVSLSNISDLTTIISYEDQEGLHVDADAGKSINAIRPVPDRGKLVCGARTLDGNSNEWRYINVRRFFNMVEESCKKASESSVFEPNDCNTWVRVRGMIEIFLLIQWRAGALQGAVWEHAFFVKVGLGETMTELDILEGRMIVEIGMAVVRPAEFIILRFSHKMPIS